MGVSQNSEKASFSLNIDLCFWCYSIFTSFTWYQSSWLHVRPYVLHVLMICSVFNQHILWALHQILQREINRCERRLIWFYTVVSLHRWCFVPVLLKDAHCFLLIIRLPKCTREGEWVVRTCGGWGWLVVEITAPRCRSIYSVSPAWAFPFCHQWKMKNFWIPSTCCVSLQAPQIHWVNIKQNSGQGGSGDKWSASMCFGGAPFVEMRFASRYLLQVQPFRLQSNCIWEVEWKMESSGNGTKRIIRV